MSLLPSDPEGEAIARAKDRAFGIGFGAFTQNLVRAHWISTSDATVANPFNLR